MRADIWFVMRAVNREFIQMHRTFCDVVYKNYILRCFAFYAALWLILCIFNLIFGV